jgi:DNA-binding NtrC family response regulator
MTSKPSALVVAPTHAIACKLFAWLTDAGWAPLLVPSFLDAKQHLEQNPSLMVAEIRLGEYNGLHLALRAQVRGIPVVVIGECDAVLQREAEEVGAAYMPPDIEAQQLMSGIQRLAETLQEREPWRRADLPFPPVSDRAPAARQPGRPGSPFTQ